jgi:sugar phosphate isomerase/epimerase
MQFGAMNFPIQPVTAAIETYGPLGFDYLELAMDAPRAHYRVLRNQKTDILDALKRHGMGLMGHLPTFVHIADLTPAIRAASLEEMTASLEVAAEMGMEKAVLHPGHLSGMGAFVAETALGYAYDSLARIAEKARTLGIVLCVENMPVNAGAFVEPDDFKGLFSRFPEFRMTLDVGHAHIHDKSRRRPVAFIRRHGSRLDHLHLSDNNGKRDDHIQLGRGTVNLTAIVKALKDVGYDGTVTLEIFTEDIRHLTASLAHLKTLL